jgi:hypothetical protein
MPLQVHSLKDPVAGTGGYVRPFVYMLLVGAACGLLLLPLRAALASAPAWTTSSQAVMAREGRYTQNLGPGETRIYVLEMAGHSLLKVQFSGAGLGLRIEDGDGKMLGAVDAASVQPRPLGVVNPAGTAQTLYLTVYRKGESAHRHALRHDGDRRRAADELSASGPPGEYALELARDVMP